MALNGNFVSFRRVLESVYRKTGYQKIDINEAIEVIGDTIAAIGVLPAFKDVVTNGLNDNPIPLEVADYRVILPSNFVTLKAVRKVNLIDDVDDEGTAIKRISSFSPMYYATDIFYQSTASQHQTQDANPGTYTAYAIATQYSVTLVGSSGTCNITDVGNLTRLVTFDTDLSTTASNFVTAFAADYALVGITVESDDEIIIFTETTAGSGLVEKPGITNLTGDLNAIVERNDVSQDPVIVEGDSYQFKEEYVYTYKVNNGYIYTNFESGYIELVYTAFVTDEHGYPMIPDDQRFINAIMWSLIEHFDYKKLRVGEITRDIYEHSDQMKCFYIASAISKASIPSPDEMNALKNMMLRSIKRVDDPDSYFKYSNIQEQRYTHNSPIYNARYFRR